MGNKREINTHNCKYYIDKDSLILYAIETNESNIKYCYELHLDVSTYPELRDDFKLIDYSEMVIHDGKCDFINNLQEFECTPSIKNKLNRYLWIMSIGGITNEDLGLADTFPTNSEPEIDSVDNQSCVTKDIVKFSRFVNIFDRMLDVSPTNEPRIDITTKLDKNIDIEHIYIDITDGENTERFSIPVSNLCSFSINENVSLMILSFTKLVTFDK